jgi:hypothetical protein
MQRRYLKVWWGHPGISEFCFLVVLSLSLGWKGEGGDVSHLTNAHILSLMLRPRLSCSMLWLLNSGWNTVSTHWVKHSTHCSALCENKVVQGTERKSISITIICITIQEESWLANYELNHFQARHDRCTSVNSGGWGRRIMSLRPAWDTQWDPVSKNW